MAALCRIRRLYGGDRADDQTIRLGVAINVLPLHNPIDVAESYAMVDVVSNGRLDFGVGKGSESHEYKKFGVDQKEATGRMYEGVEVMLQAWSDKPVNFKGEFYNYQNVPVFPKPVQRPHPNFWVGCARSEDSFRWAGEHGFHLMTLPYLYREPEMLPGFIKTYRDNLAKAGHDAGKADILGKFHIYVANSLEDAIREAEPYLINYFDVHKAADPDRLEQGLLTQRDARTQLERGICARRGSQAGCRHDSQVERRSRADDDFRHVSLWRYAAGVGVEKYSVVRGEGYAGVQVKEISPQRTQRAQSGRRVRLRTDQRPGCSLRNLGYPEPS